MIKEDISKIARQITVNHSYLDIQFNKKIKEGIYQIDIVITNPEKLTQIIAGFVLVDLNTKKHLWYFNSLIDTTDEDILNTILEKCIGAATKIHEFLQ